MTSDVVWIDLGIRDPDRAAAFYRGLLGWEVADADPSGYRLAGIRGQLVAGLGGAEDLGDPYWTAYLSTDDAERTTRAAVSAGASIVIAPAPVGTAGIAATLRDPSGATFALWQPLDHPGTPRTAEPGTMAGFALAMPDPASARPFWTAVAGWTCTDAGVIESGGAAIGQWTRFPPDGAASPWLITFRGPDRPEGRTIATRLGGSVIDAGRGLIRDPCGALCRIVGPGYGE